MPSPRLSIARKALLDQTIAVSANAAAASSTASPAAVPTVPGGAGGSETLRGDSETEKSAADRDVDLSSTFDVPAFLRRQEG